LRRLSLAFAGVPAAMGIAFFAALMIAGQTGAALAVLAACGFVAALYGLVVPAAAAKQGGRKLAKVEQQLDDAVRLRRLETELDALREEVALLRSMHERQRLRIDERHGADENADGDAEGAARRRR